MIEVKINGEKREIANKLSLTELLENLSLPTERLAIELNKEVIRKKQWNETFVAPNDVIEIIHFVGGG